MAKATSSKYNTYYEKSRYNLVWNLCVIFCVVMAIVSSLNFSNPQYSGTPNIVAIIYASLCMIIMKRTKDYKIPSRMLSVLSFVLISVTYFLLDNAIHYTTPMWMIANVLFTYFTLKSIWGTVILTLHFVVLNIYIFTEFDYNVHTIHPFDTQDLFNYAIEFTILGFSIAYILFQFVKSNNYAETELTEINQNLTSKNQIISKQNVEMDIMLKEIHHRVKNNLQVIISLLKLQSHRQNGNNTSVFQEAINRVNAMSAIHEQLYQGELLASFNLEKYLESFAKQLVHSYITDKKVKIEIASNFDNLSHKNIVPVALLFNELITNSLKHAFRSQNEPLISIQIQKVNTNTFLLKFSDNGLWVDSTLESFGTELIEAMTDQLDGTMKLMKTESGTSYEFELHNVK